MKRQVTIELDESQLKRLSIEGGALAAQGIYLDVREQLHEAAKKLFPHYLVGQWYKVTFQNGRQEVLVRTEDGWKANPQSDFNYYNDLITPAKSAVRMVEAED